MPTRNPKTAPAWEELGVWCRATTMRLRRMEGKLDVLVQASAAGLVIPELEYAVRINWALTHRIDVKVPDKD